MSTSAFVDQLYTQFLFREADTSGKSWWSEQLSSGQMSTSSVTQSFVDSAEFQSNVADVVKLYYLVFDRIPDQSGLTYWVNQKQQGMSLSDISTAFATSDEFSQRYGSGLSDNDFIDQLYQNAFSRSPDINGKSWWLSKLSSGTARSELLISFSSSDEFNNLSGSKVQASSIYYGIVQRQPTDAELATIPSSSSDLISQLYASAEYTGSLPDGTVNVFAGDDQDNVLTGTAQRDEIYGGSGDDIITGEGGADQLTGGDGADRFQFTLGQSTPEMLTTVTDFWSGSLADRIEFKQLANYNYQKLAGSYTDLDEALNSARSVADNTVAVFTISGTDSYLYVPNAGQGEFLVKLQGNNGDTLFRHDNSIRTFIEGGTGDDVISHNGSLDSYIEAGAGNDQVFGGTEHDQMLLGAGNDIFDGRAGDDMLVANEAAVIFNGSDQTLVVNGISVAANTVVGANEAAHALVGEDQFTNFEAVLTGDQADFIAEGASIRNINASGGNDVILADEAYYSTLLGGDGQDTFVFQSANSIVANWYDILSDFDFSEDKFLFVTEGSYQLSSQLIDYGQTTQAEVLSQIQGNSSLADSVMIYKSFTNTWLYINGDGGVSNGPSLHNTLIKLADDSVSSAEALIGVVSFSTEIPTLI